MYICINIYMYILTYVHIYIYRCIYTTVLQYCHITTCIFPTLFYQSYYPYCLYPRLSHSVLVLRNHVIYHIHVHVDDSRPANTAFQLFETHLQFPTLPHALKQCPTDGRDECFGPSVKMVLSLQPTARNTSLTYV